MSINVINEHLGFNMQPSGINRAQPIGDITKPQKKSGQIILIKFGHQMICCALHYGKKMLFVGWEARFTDFGLARLGWSSMVRMSL